MNYPGLDVKKLSDEQIQKRIAELSNRLSRQGLRSDIIFQMRAILDILRQELSDRQFVKSTENNPKWQAGVVLDTEEAVEDKDDLDKLINIS